MYHKMCCIMSEQVRQNIMLASGLHVDSEDMAVCAMSLELFRFLRLFQF